MESKRYLGAALKWLRSQRGWAQKELAATAKITRAMVSSYEKGKQMPTLPTIDKIMTALGADFCDLHYAFEHVNGRPMTVHELSAHFRYGQAKSLETSRQKRSSPDKVGAEMPEPAAAQGEQPLSDDLERALSDMFAGVNDTVAGAQRLLRHALLGK
jgi:transcriptional regulator with XRE-family HTH domain